MVVAANFRYPVPRSGVRPCVDGHKTFGPGDSCTRILDVHFDGNKRIFSLINPRVSCEDLAPGDIYCISDRMKRMHKEREERHARYMKDLGGNKARPGSREWLEHEKERRKRELREEIRSRYKEL